MADRDETGSGQPEFEVFVEGADGTREPVDAGPAAKHPPTRSMTRRAGLVLAVAAAFAVGMVVGHTGLNANTTSGASTPLTTDSLAPPPTTGRATSAPTTMHETTTHTTDLATSTARTTADSTAGASRPPWPVMPGACGNSQPAPLIDIARAHHAPIDTTLIAGGYPSEVNLTTRTVSDALFTPDGSHYVAAAATGRNATVLLVASCGNDEASRVLRVGAGGRTTDVDLPDNAAPNLSLIGGGQRVWITVANDPINAPVVLLAADGSGDTVTLPPHFAPLHANNGRIIGMFYNGGLPSGPIEVYDIDREGITNQFGPPAGLADGAINAVAENGYVIWSPWACVNSCKIYTHRLSTGDQHRANLDPATDGVLAGGAAISPDGTLAAVLIQGQPPSPKYADPDPDLPGGTTRIALIDLRDGTVSILPGVTFAMTAPAALTFSGNGRWLIVSIATKDGTRVLLYTSAGEGPYDTGLTIPGPSIQPVLITTSR